MIYLKNDKGLSAMLLMCPFVSDHAIDLLRQHVANGQASEDMSRFVALASTLPLHPNLSFPAMDWPSAHNFKTPARGWDMFVAPMRGVLLPGRFKSKMPESNSSKHLNCSASPQGLGWAQVSELLALGQDIQTEAAALGVDIALEDLASIQRELPKAKWTIVESGMEHGMEGCMVYRVGAEGFVGHKSDSVVFHHARIFENQEAAQRLIDLRLWDDAVIVRASVKLEGICPNQKLPKSLGLLQAVFAQQQATLLEQSTPSSPHARPRRF